MKYGFQYESKDLDGFFFWDKKGEKHFVPSTGFVDKYLDSYIDAMKILRPVSKITKEL